MSKKFLENFEELSRPKIILPLHQEQIKKAIIKACEGYKRQGSQKVFSFSYFFTSNIMKPSFVQKLAFLVLIAGVTIGSYSFFSQSSLPEAKAKDLLLKTMEEVQELPSEKRQEVAEGVKSNFDKALEEAAQAKDLKDCHQQQCSVDLDDLPFPIVGNERFIEYTNSQNEMVILGTGQNDTPQFLFVFSPAEPSDQQKLHFWVNEELLPRPVQMQS